MWGVWECMRMWVCYVYCAHGATYQILLKMKSTFFEHLDVIPRLWDCWVMYLLYSYCAYLKQTKQHALPERCCMQLGNQSLHASLLTTPVCSLYTLSIHYFDIWIPPWTQTRTQIQTWAWILCIQLAKFHLTAKHKRFCKVCREPLHFCPSFLYFVYAAGFVKCFDVKTCDKDHISSDKTVTVLINFHYISF